MTQPDRVETLELAVRALHAEVAALRAEVGRLRGAAPEPGASMEEAAPPPLPLGGPPQTHHRPPRAGERHRADAPWIESVPAATHASPRPTTFEALVGRYGTLALGALALVMALGAWLSWAIENYQLSDAARVALGALGAAAVAGVGLWLRHRGITRYGNVLLGIALALFHVDAWGAGPVLGVVSPAVALGAAAVASAALAALAYRNHDESLFVVGVGGALAAPFVTSDGTHHTIALLLYGWLVLGGSIYALRGRGWRNAEWLVLAGTLVFAVVGAVSVPEAGSPWYHRDAPLFFALNVAATAWAAEPGERRGSLARLLLYVAIVPALIYHDIPRVVADRVALAFAATVLAYLSLREAADDPRGWLDRLALPLAFLGAAMASTLSVHEPPSLTSAAVIMLWAGAALCAGLVAPASREERGIDLAVAGIAGAAAIPVALGTGGARAPIALAAHAALFCFVLRRVRQPVVAVPLVLSLAAAGFWSFVLLDGRPPYEYVPFLTRASAAAAAAVAACALLSWLFSRRALRSEVGMDDGAALLIGALGPAAAFLWVNQELSYAGSPNLANFAIIAYWAVVGVLAIFVGRGRSIALARQVGLGLAILAALKAVIQASDQGSIALRIGSYLLVGVFLLAVAYWYRGGGESDRLAAGPADPDRTEPEEVPARLG